MKNRRRRAIQMQRKNDETTERDLSCGSLLLRCHVGSSLNAFAILGFAASQFRCSAFSSDLSSTVRTCAHYLANCLPSSTEAHRPLGLHWLRRRVDCQFHL